jgi:thiol-disulfide isomerase/thioredoxin
MKKFLLCLLFCLSLCRVAAQSDYEITINLKNCNDTLAYLTYYQMDKTMIKDTCTTIKNGEIIFKGKGKLDKGIYSLISQQKNIYFDFFVDDTTQNLKLKSEVGPNILTALTALNSPMENDFFNYLRFITNQNKEFIDIKQKTVLQTKKDTLALTDVQKRMETGIAKYEEDFLQKNKGSYIAKVVNLKMEKVLRDAPKTDVAAEVAYYKKHYWDNVDFHDDGTMRNPFFYKKLKKYFDSIIPAQADSVNLAVDQIMDRTLPGSMFNKMMLAHFTYTYETSDIMGFDKVFVHMSDAYFKTGKAKGVYEDDVIERIIKRADKLKPLLIGATAQDLSMIKAEDFAKMKSMGFESAKNSEEMTKVFYEHADEVNKMFVKLSDVKAAYTLLIFWDVDCGHCQKEIPKLVTVYNELLGEHKDIKVFSVYMQHEGEKYLKYIAEHQLPWINVYDGAHYNNAVEKYDVYTTPVIYLLDKNKVIKAKRISVEQIKNLISDLESGKLK